MAREDTSQPPPPPIASPEAHHMVSSVKLPILKKGEYILWAMKMKQYLAHTDYALWEQILARTRERKAKSILLMDIPDEHLARFHGIKDTNTLWPFQMSTLLIKTRFGGVSTEDANQKFLRSLPSAWSNISLIMKNKPGIDNLDIDDLYNNLKVYEADIKGSSGSFSNSQNVAFVFAESTNNTNELNVAYSVCIATGHSSKAQGSSSYELKEQGRDAGKAGYKGRDNGKRSAKEEDEKALVVQDGLGTYDWSYRVEEEATDFALMAFTLNPSGSSSSNSELDEALREKEDLKSKNKKFETSAKKLPKLLDSQISAKVKTGLGYHSPFNEKEVLDIKEEEVTETMFDNLSSDKENSLANDRFKKSEGYHVVPLPFTRNYMPPISDVSFARLDNSIYKFKISEIVAILIKDEKDAPETKTICVEKPKEDRSSAPLIYDWDTDSDNDSVFRPELIPAKIDFVKAGESVKHGKPVKSVKHVNLVKPVKTAEQTKKSKKFSSSPKVDRKHWNGKTTQKLGLGFRFTKKACFMCGRISHLIKDCTFHEDRMAKKSMLPTNVGKGTCHRESRLVLNNVQRINHQNKFAPITIFTRSGRIPVSAAKLKATASTSATKPVNTAGPK
nr:ribonuclease H-like domain-containing protein [Tanacetum cinerariifolium]